MIERDNDPTTTWIAVNSQPNRECLAAVHLRKQGYEVYVPCIRKQVRHARKVQDVRRPLFPSYLFVRLTADCARWRPILSTAGVRSVVYSGDRPSVVPCALIDGIRSQERDGVIVRSNSSRQIGEIVRVAQGPFDGLAGKIIELADNDRLTVLMDLLNRSVKVTVPGAFLAVA